MQSEKAGSAHLRILDAMVLLGRNNQWSESVMGIASSALICHVFHTRPEYRVRNLPRRIPRQVTNFRHCETPSFSRHFAKISQQPGLTSVKLANLVITFEFFSVAVRMGVVSASAGNIRDMPSPLQYSRCHHRILPEIRGLGKAARLPQ